VWEYVIVGRNIGEALSVGGGGGKRQPACAGGGSEREGTKIGR